LQRQRDKILERKQSALVDEDGAPLCFAVLWGDPCVYEKRNGVCGEPSALQGQAVGVEYQRCVIRRLIQIIL